MIGVGGGVPGKVVWTVLLSREIESAMRLYEGALGWWFEPLLEAPVKGWLARGVSDEPLAVFLDTSGSDFPAATELWLPCLSVERLGERLQSAETFGATLLRPPMEIAGFGQVAVLRQPGGAIVGWMTPSAPV